MDSEFVLRSRCAASLEKAVLLVRDPLVHGECFSDPPMLVAELQHFM